MTYTRVIRSLAIVLSAIAAFVAINMSLSYAHYDLYTDGKWRSAKTQLKKGVVGAWSMMFTRAGLRGSRLNLNAWNGYQQLILKDAVDAQKIEFTVQPSKVPFSLIIDDRDSVSTGLMFYPQGKKKMIFYTADHGGHFLLQSDIPIVTQVSDGKVAITFTGDSAEIHLDGILQAKISLSVPSQIYPGFRGSSGLDDVYIDDIRITSPSNKIVLSEDFSFPFRIYQWTLACFLLWLPLILCCLYSVRYSALIVFVSFMMTFLIAILSYGYSRMSNHYTRDPSSINWHGMRSTIETKQEVEARLDQEYPVAQIAGKKKVILFVGSSQTWGAGASEAKKTFASIVQDSLRNILHDSNIVVINTGISGIRTSDMYNLYIQKCAAYKPVLTVIDASNNDTDIPVFRKNIQAFAEYDRSHGIQSVWIEEPNDGVKKPSDKHLVMRTISAKNNITCIEIQSYLQDQYDSGYLWWDQVHLTDYGQQLFASRLTPIIIQKLKEDSITLPHIASRDRTQ